MSIFKSVLLGGMLLLSSSVALAQVSLSQNSSGSNVFSLVGKKDKACVYYDAQDFEVVKTTAGLFANDVKEVSGQILGVATTKEAPQKNCIIVGTLGHNEWIDQMIAKKKLDVEPLKDRWESYLVQLVRNPLPGVDKALVIVGSDRRGAAYGLLSVSRTIGVSPWYWWVVHLFHRESQAVQKYATFSFRGYQPIACYFFVLFISFHVLEADPASAPTSRCQLETEPIRDISLGGKEFKTNGILLRDFIINP